MGSTSLKMELPILFKLVKRRYLFFIVVVVGLLAAIDFGLLFLAHSRRSEVMRRNAIYDAETGLAVQAEAIKVSLEEIFLDTLFLAVAPEIMEGLRSEDFSGLEQMFSSFARAKKKYSQVRFLDAGGMETVRINYQSGASTVVPRLELQDKSGRNYFLAARECSPGEVYCSPLDLNVENGEIELPYKPTLRFASPVYVDGGYRGVVVLNYNAQNLLDRVDGLSALYLGDYYLLNPEGYYLASPKSSDEWGFMFHYGKGRRFDVDFPLDWESLSNEDTCISRKDVGVLVSRIIDLPGKASESKWIAVNRIPPEILVQKMQHDRRMLLTIFIFLLPVNALIAVILRRQLLGNLNRHVDLYRSANFDELTGLPNRQMGMERLESMLALCSRYHMGGGVFFIDLDGFKEVNDCYGHNAGDELLQEVARRLQATIRHSDTAIRLGGDEFVVLAPYNHSVRNLRILAQKLLDVLVQPYEINGNVLHVGASIGVRRIGGRPEEELAVGKSRVGSLKLDPETVLQEADEAMYMAKNSGKGRYRFFEDGPRTTEG